MKFFKYGIRSFFLVAIAEQIRKIFESNELQSTSFLQIYCFVGNLSINVKRYIKKRVTNTVKLNKINYLLLLITDKLMTN